MIVCLEINCCIFTRGHDDIGLKSRSNNCFSKDNHNLQRGSAYQPSPSSNNRSHESGDSILILNVHPLYVDVRLSSVKQPIMSTIDFHVLSDLHLEHFPGFRLERARVTAPHLILAGDIGCPSEPEYVDFMRHCSELFESVSVVMGNHEAYGARSLDDGIDRVSTVCGALDNVHFLHRGSCDIAPRGQRHPRLRVLGTTLWSHVPAHREKDVGCFIADYRQIPGFTVRSNNEAHEAEVRWLDAEIARAEAEQTDLVVVTHHAPRHGTSHPKNDGSPLNCAFSTDLTHLLNRKPIKLWVHGHTHYNHLGQSVLVTNQRGYASKPDEGVRFDPYRTFCVQNSSKSLELDEPASF